MALLFSALLLFSSSVAALTDEERASIARDSVWYTSEVVASGCSGTGDLSGNGNAEKVFNFFVSKGLKPFQAAAIIGNMTVESGVEPQRLQGTAAAVKTPAEQVDPSTELGWGIVQWTPARKFINTQRPIWKANELGVQLAFLWDQLEGRGPLPEKQAGDDLKATTSVEDAVLAFQGNRQVGGKYFGFERPADQRGTVDLRTAAARDALAKFGSGSGTTTSSGGCTSVALGTDGCPTTPIKQSETVLAAGIRVHPCIAKEVERIMNLAKEQGLDLKGWGYRTTEQQEGLRREYGCDGREYDKSCNTQPPTAIPGTSNHEFGAAIDFTCNGGRINVRSNPCYRFLDGNTSLKNLPSEAWHWSNDGT